MNYNNNQWAIPHQNNNEPHLKMTNIDGTTEPSQLNQEKRRKLNNTTHLQQPNNKLEIKHPLFTSKHIKLHKQNQTHTDEFNKKHKNPTKTTTQKSAASKTFKTQCAILNFRKTQWLVINTVGVQWLKNTFWKVNQSAHLFSQYKENPLQNINQNRSKNHKIN